MTGTAETEANEFRDIYHLDVLVIPTNRPVRRVDTNDVVYRTRREKFSAILRIAIVTSVANGAGGYDFGGNLGTVEPYA